MTPEQAIDRLARAASKRELCRADAFRKLRGWGIAPEEQQPIVDELVRLHFIDEQRYVELFVREKSQINRWGKRKIQQQLQAKGIAADLMAPFLQKIDPTDTREALRTLLQQKQKTLPTSDNPYRQRQKLIRYALSRGYVFDDIEQCLPPPT